MFRPFILLSIFLFSSLFDSFSQENVLFEFNTLETRSFVPKASYLIENNNNGNLAVFIEYSKGLDAFLLSKDNEMVTSFGAEGLPRRYNQIIGQILDGNQIQIFMKTDSNKKFGSITFDFDNKTTSVKELGFKLKNESFLQTVSNNDSFYIFTIKKTGSAIMVYHFTKDGSYHKNIIDLSKEVFFKGDTKVHLDDLVSESSGLSSSVAMLKVDSDVPNSIESTSQINKFYEQQDHVVMSFDKSSKSTYVLEISLSDFSYTLRDFPKPSFEGKPYKKSASFIKDDLFLQFSSNKKQMEFSIKNWKSNETIRSFQIRMEDPIPFANTPVIIEGGYYDSNRVREVEETEKFLRKISRGDLGISLYKNKTGYQITLGGTQKLSGGGAPMMMPMGGMPISQFGSATLYFNPVIYSYYSYTTSKSIRIESLFDLDFNNRDGEIEENVFDLISSFEKELRNNKLIETINKFGDNYLYSYYDKRMRKYRGLLFD